VQEGDATIHVAVGVLRDARGRVLIARRPHGSHQGGLWELPGGKLDGGEVVEAALARELAEELGVTVLAATPLLQVLHAYPDRRVLLDTWEVRCYRGEPVGREGQPLAWVEPERLQRLAFPAADRPIIEALGLPERYAWLSAADPALVQASLAAGLRLLAVPASSSGDSLRRGVAACGAADAVLLLAGRPLGAPIGGAAGWHLPAAELARPEPAFGNGRLAADCPALADAARALALGCHFVVVEQAPACSLPFYLSADSGASLEDARAVGARGVVERWG